MTKSELARLVRVARSASGYLRVSATEVRFYCPLDIEAKRKVRDQTMPHTFTVGHVPWEKGTSVKEVTEALTRHIDPDAEECEHVRHD